MANTYVLIASSTVGSGGAANIEFTSIPNTYTDLLVKFSARCATSGTGGINVRVQFNSDTGNNYSTRRIVGNGSTAVSYSASSEASIIVGIAETTGDTASTFSNCEFLVPNYNSSNYKSVSSDAVHETNNAQAYAYLIAGLWSSSSAITSLKLIMQDSSNFAQYSTAYLYGIKNS